MVQYHRKSYAAYFFLQKFVVPILTSGGLAAISAAAFAALYSAFGKYDVVHIHAEGTAFFSWLPKMFGKRVVVTIHGKNGIRHRPTTITKIATARYSTRYRFINRVRSLWSSVAAGRYMLEDHGGANAKFCKIQHTQHIGKKTVDSQIGR